MPDSGQIERAYEMGADPHDIYLFVSGLPVYDVFTYLTNEEKQYVLTGDRKDADD